MDVHSQWAKHWNTEIKSQQLKKRKEHICPLDGSIFFCNRQKSCWKLATSTEQKLGIPRWQRREEEILRKWKIGNRPKIQNLQSAQVTGLYKFQTRYVLADISCKGLVDVYGFRFFGTNSFILPLIPHSKRVPLSLSSWIIKTWHNTTSTEHIIHQ